MIEPNPPEPIQTLDVSTTAEEHDLDQIWLGQHVAVGKYPDGTTVDVLASGFRLIITLKEGDSRRTFTIRYADLIQDLVQAINDGGDPDLFNPEHLPGDDS